jgi:hypothetical protein
MVAPLLLPALEVFDPDGHPYQTLELKEDRLTIGRLSVSNDLALEPDPQQLISRKGHCVLERDASGRWVVDNGSVNGTFLQQSGTVQMVLGRARLAHQSCIRLLGRLSESGGPYYWTLRFTDLGETRDGPHDARLAVLEYDWVQARLFRVEGRRRQEIGDLRPQEHKLIRYMDQRNRANGQVPVMCPYEELLTAIWGEEPLHTEDEISHLIYELRQKLEPNPREPQFLQTVKGLGYRLVTRPLSQ